MNIKECVDFINFWIRKERGAFLTIEESIEVIDRGQIAYYNDIIPKYATSQIIKDCLQPFKARYNFNVPPSDPQLITVPNSDYLDMLSMEIRYTENGTTVYYPIKMVNEDEIADRLNSQIDPVTSKAPVGEMYSARTVKLYPDNATYVGTITYMRRPVKPVYDYNIISGRIINFIPPNVPGSTTVNLEWRETDINMVLIKALSNIGINLSDGEVMQYAQLKSQENYQGVNHI